MRQVALIAASCGLIAGCTSGGAYRARIHSDDVNERILAVRQAAEQNDKSAVPLLVDRLEDEDEAVRFFSILALDRITGQRFGYEYGQPAYRRAKSVEKWRLYVQNPDRAVAMEKEEHASAEARSPKTAPSNY